jgi:tetratricopeptide (TPR) repeat protein
METNKIYIMKRFFLSLLITVVSLGLFAQKGKVASALNYIDAGELGKAIEALDGTETNEKTKDWAKTYYAKGKLAQALYNSKDEKLKAKFDDPLIVAYHNYLKVIELDDKGSVSKTIPLQIAALSNDFLIWAGEEFESENYAVSLKAFETAIEIQKSDLYAGTLDTVLLFNAGIVALNAEEYDKSLAFFNQCIEMEHAEDAPYEYIHSIYNIIDDPENAEMILIKGYERYPEAQNLLMNLIQFYIVNEKDDEALEYIEQAKASSPNNHRLHWAEGVLFMKQDKLEKATVALGKSIEIDPDFFDTQYNMGVCFYNMGVELFTAANDIVDNAKYNAAVEEAKLVFAKAIPYMERALELNETDLDSMRSLKELYYRLQMTEKYDEIVQRIADNGGEE